MNDKIYVVKNNDGKIMDINGKFKYDPERLDPDEVAYFDSIKEARKFFEDEFDKNYKILEYEDMFK